MSLKFNEAQKAFEACCHRLRPRVFLCFILGAQITGICVISWGRRVKFAAVVTSDASTFCLAFRHFGIALLQWILRLFSECPLYYVLHQLLLTSINMFSHAACTNLRGKRSVTWSWFSLREELRRQLKIVEILVTGVELTKIQVREII